MLARVAPAFDANREFLTAVKAFADQAVNDFHDFKEFLALYYCSEEQIDLLNKSAAGFFSELYYIYIDRIVLNMSRLADRSTKQSNLTVGYIDERCPWRCNDDATRGQELVGQLEAIAGSVKRWRNKAVAHADLNVAVGADALGEEFSPREAARFYGVLGEYVNRVHAAVDLGPFEIDGAPAAVTSSQCFDAHAGVLDLVRTLREGIALRRVRARNLFLYDQILHEASGSQDG